MLSKKLLPVYNSEALITLLSISLLLLYFVVKALGVPDQLCQISLMLLLIVGGCAILFKLAVKVIHLELGSDLLAGIAVIAAVMLEQYLAGSIIVLMFFTGSSLEQYARRKASSTLEALSKRMPRIAHILKDNKIEEVQLKELYPGELVVVLPHEICPVDGYVVEGSGHMDESYLTGEPFLISKVIGSQVFSGAANGASALTVKVEKLLADSRYSKIMQIMHETELKRPQMRRMSDSLAVWFTPVALCVAGLAWLISGEPMRFLAVLVIATPCPLLLAIPIAIMGAISICASKSIIVKNPAALEQVELCRTMIFDKTGTLTYGKPMISEILCSPSLDRERAIQFAASLEQYSKHPLSAAILEEAQQDKIDLLRLEKISEKPGQGLSGTTDGMPIRLIGRKIAAEQYNQISQNIPPSLGGLESILIVNNEFAALFRFHDEARQESPSFIRHLAPKHNINRIMIVSGDRKDEVNYLANKVGINEVLFEKSPEEKVEIVRQAAKSAPTLFLGDGINDAPAMQAATVGIAFGMKSDITAESADVVIIDASLNKVNELIHVGKRLKKIALQSALGGMLLSTLGMFMAALGYLQPVSGAITQEVIDIMAVLNALRMVIPDERAADYAE